MTVHLELSKNPLNPFSTDYILSHFADPKTPIFDLKSDESNTPEEQKYFQEAEDLVNRAIKVALIQEKKTVPLILDDLKNNLFKITRKHFRKFDQDPKVQTIVKNLLTKTPLSEKEPSYKKFLAKIGENISKTSEKIEADFSPENITKEIQSRTNVAKAEWKKTLDDYKKKMGIEAPYVEMPKQYLEKITYNIIPFVVNIKFSLNLIVKKIGIFQITSSKHCLHAEMDKSRKSLNKNTSDTKAGGKTEEKEIFQRSLKSYKKYAQALISFYEKEPLTSFYVQKVFTECNKQLHGKDYFKLYISSNTDLEHSDEAKETKLDSLSSSIEQLDLSDEKNGINLLLQKN